MIELKKIFISISLIMFLSSCTGYTPIFSKKNVNFSIETIEFLGDREVKEKIDQALSGYKNKKNKEKKISLMLQNSKYSTIVSKNSKGEAQKYKISVQVNMKIILSENNFFEKNIEKSAIYDSIESKSEEKLIKNKLIEDLSNQIAQQIIFEILNKTK